MKGKNQLVVKDPEILGGEPIIKGTRIPVSLLASLMKKGYPSKLISVEYPSLSIQKIAAFRKLIESGAYVSQAN